MQILGVAAQHPHAAADLLPTGGSSAAPNRLLKLPENAESTETKNRKINHQGTKECKWEPGSLSVFLGAFVHPSRAPVERTPQGGIEGKVLKRRY
jgi:hypothetical protein